MVLITETLVIVASREESGEDSYCRQAFALIDTWCGTVYDGQTKLRKIPLGWQIAGERIRRHLPSVSVARADCHIRFPPPRHSSSRLWAPRNEVCGNYVVLGFAGGMYAASKGGSQ